MRKISSIGSTLSRNLKKKYLKSIKHLSISSDIKSKTPGKMISRALTLGKKTRKILKPRCSGKKFTTVITPK